MTSGEDPPARPPEGPTAEGEKTLRRACDLLLVSLALPPLLQHGLSFVLAELLPIHGPDALRVVGTAMLLIHLLVATPLSLAAYPGGLWLVRSNPTPRHIIERLVQALAPLFALLTALTVLARFTLLLPITPLQDASGAVRLLLGLTCTVSLLAGHTRVPRPLLLATVAAFFVALVFHTLNLLYPDLPPDLLLGARSGAAAAFGVCLLLARRGHEAPGQVSA